MRQGPVTLQQSKGRMKKEPSKDSQRERGHLQLNLAHMIPFDQLPNLYRMSLDLNNNSSGGSVDVYRSPHERTDDETFRSVRSSSVEGVDRCEGQRRREQLPLRLEVRQCLDRTHLPAWGRDDIREGEGVISRRKECEGAEERLTLDPIEVIIHLICLNEPAEAKRPSLTSPWYSRAPM